ncbi:hypothetical protein MD484_g8126, partial [Candolleomyces efflorescens]
MFSPHWNDVIANAVGLEAKTSFCLALGYRISPTQERTFFLSQTLAMHLQGLLSDPTHPPLSYYFSYAYTEASLRQYMALAASHGIAVCPDRQKVKDALFQHIASASCSNTHGSRSGCAAIYIEGAANPPPFVRTPSKRSLALYIFNHALAHRSKAIPTLLQMYGCACHPNVEQGKYILLASNVRDGIAQGLMDDYTRSNDQSTSHISTPSSYANVSYRPEVSWPPVISAEEKKKCIKAFRVATSSDALRTSVCCACGIRALCASMKRYHADEIDLEPLKPTERPYPLPFLGHPTLEEYLLDPRGVHLEDGNALALDLCHTCHSSLSRNALPRLALANDLYQGPIPPELAELSTLEQTLIARGRAKCTIVQLKSEGSGELSPMNQRGLRGNVIMFPQHPEMLPPLLPPPMQDIIEHICVVFIGSKLPTREWFAKYASPLLVRPSRIRAALVWLKAHNPLYHDVKLNQECLDQMPSDGTMLPFHIEHIDSSFQIDVATSRYDPSFPPPSSTGTTSSAQNPIPFQALVVTNIDQNASSRELRAAALRHVYQDRRSFLAVPHDNGPLSDYDNTSLFPSIYPTLFPFGVAGFEEPSRRLPVSLKCHIKHLLSLADTRFQDHPSFMFAAFNVLQRRQMLLSVSMKIKRPNFANVARTLGSISSSVVHNVAEKILAGSEPSGNISESEKAVHVLMKEVQLLSRTIPCSNAARGDWRNEIKAMCISCALPFYYCTVNFPDVYNPVVKFLSKEDFDLDSIPDNAVPLYFDQARLVAKNPVIPAKFFNIYMKAFIEHLLGFKGPKQNFDFASAPQGILGKTRAFYGCVEAQGRGTLHCHMVIWIHGSLNPNELKAKLIDPTESEFRARLVSYLNNCISSAVPTDPGDHIVVPSSKHHPCSVLGVDFRDPEMSTDAHRQKDLRNVVLVTQIHYHSATCYKYWKGPPEPKECRFGLDQSCIKAETTIDMETGEIAVRHLDPTVNCFNDAISEATRCNNDMKVIASGETAKVISCYITDYISKSQMKAHVAYAALELGVHKLEQLEMNGDPINDISFRSKRLLQKCAYEILARQELSAPQVASYLMDYEDHFTSHSFRRLFWTQAERHVEHHFPLCGQASPDTPPVDPLMDEEVVIDHNSAGEIEPRTSQLRDYIYRGDLLNGTSFWNFVARINKVKRTINGSIDNEQEFQQWSQDMHVKEGFWRSQDFLTVDSVDRPICRLVPPHDEHRISYLCIVSPEAAFVPVPVGPSIPRRDRPQLYERYCRLMLILFKPWRHPRELKGAAETWADAFTAFKSTSLFTPSVADLLENMQLFHECRDSRDDHFKNRHAKSSVARQLPASSDFVEEMENAILDDLGTHEQDVEYEHSMAQGLTQILNKHSDRTSKRDQDIESCLSFGAACGLFERADMSLYANILPQAVCQSQKQHIRVFESDLRLEDIWKSTYTERRAARRIAPLRDMAGDNANVRATLQCGPSTRAEQGSVSTQVLNVDNLPSRTLSSDHPSKTLTDRMTTEQLIDHVAEGYTLNDDQALAFRTIAHHLTSTQPSPLRILIAGAAGTGKSRVIDALKKLFEHRGETHRYCLTSFMGIAAQNINGSTLHSALNLHCISRMKRYGKAHTDFIEKWRPIDIMVVDEVSMLGPVNVSQIDHALRIAKENEKPFGGVNVIFVGDFAQLPPVNQLKLYSRLNTTALAGTVMGQKIMFGKLLWLLVDKVVVLGIPQRQAGEENKRFLQLLSRLREGRCTTDDYRLLSSRVLGAEHAPLFSDPDSSWRYPPIIVAGNAAKDALNENCAIQFALDHQQELHWYYAEDIVGGKPITDTSLRDLLLSLDSGKTHQRLGRIPLCIGMPVLVSQNFDVEGGVVNGSRGTVISVRYKLDVVGHRILTSCVVLISSSGDNPMPNLESHEMPILSDSESIQITHPYNREKKYTFERRQVPIVPAFAMTAHRAQGQTMGRVIIDLESCSGVSAPYVMASRATSLDALYVLRSFKKDRITCPPSQDLCIENNRFKLMDLQLRARYGSSTQRMEATLMLERLQEAGQAPTWTQISEDDCASLDAKANAKLCSDLQNEQDAAFQGYEFMSGEGPCTLLGKRKRKIRQEVPNDRGLDESRAAPQRKRKVRREP